jgi:hypothetical protein
MKIIDIGICIDNKDPLGIGRIRFSRYNDYVGEVERALEYTPWDKRDIFVANSFLPNNMNFVPEIGQSVKIITYNTDKDTVNIEYIAGPFNTMFDYNGQTFSQQVTHTTYGTVNKPKSAVFTTDGQYIDKRTENSFAKDIDFAVYGKYGSDVLFTENGLILRGGKLLSKDAASEVNREALLSFPIMAKKSSRLYLKKFPKKMILEERVNNKVNVDFKDLKHIVTYNVKSNTTPPYQGQLDTDGNSSLEIDFFVYKVIDTYSETFKTYFFNNTTKYNDSAVKLINDDNSSTTPTFSVLVNSIQDIYREIRHRIFDFHQIGLSTFGTKYTDDDVHPFYFKPTDEFAARNYLDQNSTVNKKLILDNINILRIGPNHGLIFDKTTTKPQSKTITDLAELPVIVPDSAEQTFGAITADKFYLLSTDLGDNALDNPVPFYDLNEYEYTQEDYVKKIDGSTYSSVRGENLLRVLNKMIDVIFTHRHNPLMPIIGQPDYEDGNDLKELYKTLENDILNKSIRIN